MTAGPVYDVPWLVELSSYKEGRGESITAIGKGFKNGTTVRFWRDQNGDGVVQADEPTLCDATASGDDIAECDFTLANPPFVGGTRDTSGDRGRQPDQRRRWPGQDGNGASSRD